MIKYRQLVKNPGKTRKNVWYIHGNNSALVTDAYIMAKDHATSEVSSFCLGVFTKESNIQEIEEFILRPYYEERKVLIIYDPSEIKGLSEIISLSDPSLFYILVDYKRYESSEISSVVVNNSKAKHIDCSNPTEEDLKLFVNSRINIEKSALSKLVALSHLDAEWLLNKVSIFEFFDVEEITSKMVDLICSDRGTPKFEQCLLEFDKIGCLQYIKDMGVSEISVNEVMEDLHAVSILNAVSVEFSKQLRPISDKTGFSKREIEKYAKYISYYDQTTSTRCFNALMKLNQDLKFKNKSAFIALVCGW